MNLCFALVCARASALSPQREFNPRSKLSMYPTSPLTNMPRLMTHRVINPKIGVSTTSEPDCISTNVCSYLSRPVSSIRKVRTT